MIKFRCSNCHKKFGVPDTYAGRRIRCNTCDHHTFVPKQSTIDAPTAAASASEPISNPDKADDDLVLSLSNEDNPPVGNTPAQDSPMELQLQSFHNYVPLASETRIDHSLAEPDQEADTDSDMPREKLDGNVLEVRRGTPKVDRIEQVLALLSYISCIGPALFLFLIFYVLIVMAVGDSQQAMEAAFHSPPTDPNAVQASNPVLPLSAFIIAQYLLYPFCFAISPIALISSLFLVFRYAYDMPKILYFAIAAYGLVLFIFILRFI
jgi:DNA-directed RNA polymerase subunit RPC12/RpoP